MANPHMAGGNVPTPQHQNRYPQSGYPTGNYQYPGYPHANYQGYPGAVQNAQIGYSGQNPDPNMVQHGQGYNVGNYPYNPQQPQRAQSPHGQANVPYGQSPKQGPSQGQQYPPFSTRSPRPATGISTRYTPKKWVSWLESLFILLTGQSLQT